MTLFLVLICSPLASAWPHYDFIVDKLGYFVNEDGQSVTLTYLNGNNGNYDPSYAYLTQVVIPDSVTHDGQTYVVTAIDDETFRDCLRLESVTLNEHITTIGKKAFDHCYLLSEIYISASVTSIGSGAFDCCPQLGKISVSPDNTTYDTRGDCNALIETATNRLVIGCKSSIIPHDVVAIGEHAFYGSGITSITMPPTVRRVEADAFNHCRRLTDVHISDVAAWCDTEFDNAAASPLYARYTVDSLYYFDGYEWVSRATYIKQMRLYVDDQLVTQLEIPSSVEHIKAYTFGNCSYLSSVTIPRSVKSVGTDAFTCLERLQTVNIEDLGAWCDIDFANIEANPLYPLYYHAIETMEMYNSSRKVLATIIEDLFAEPRQICVNGEALTDLIIPEGVTAIKPYTFVAHPTFDMVTIPSTVTSIGTDAFRNRFYCYSQRSSTLFGVINELIWNAKNVTSCEGWQSANYYQVYTLFGEQLAYVTIGDGVETIPDYFVCTSAVTLVSLPESVKTIGKTAFAYCNNLAHVYALPAVPPTCQSDAFIKIKEYSLHTTTSAMSAYSDAPVWSNFDLYAGVVAPEQFAIAPEFSVKKMKTLTLTGTTLPADANIPLVWRSLDNSVARVDNNGVVTGVEYGETDIIVTCHNHRAVCHLTVEKELVVVTLDKQLLVMEPNETAKLVPKASIQDGDFVIYNPDPRICKTQMLNDTVEITALNPGRVVIAVTTTNDFNMVDSCLVVVKGGAQTDINSDGVSDIFDVNLVINAMLGKDLDHNPSPGGEGNVADINGDGTVDITDVNASINAMLGRDALKPLAEKQTFKVRGVKFDMVFVKGGTFTMGASDDDTDARDWDKPSHQVSVSGFSIGQTEVTQELWEAVMWNNPSTYKDPSAPVYLLNFNDCKAFINRLNELTGQTFRLPTEAEWEFAARGGTKSQGYKYAGSDNPDDVAWYHDNAPHLNGPQPVATKAPNELGLYDMSGNVEEWVQDDWALYTSNPQTNPTCGGGEVVTGQGIVRGGYYFQRGLEIKPFHRQSILKNNAYNAHGLRLAL